MLFTSQIQRAQTASLSLVRVEQKRSLRRRVTLAGGWPAISASVGRVHRKEYDTSSGFAAASKNLRVPQNRAFLGCLLLLDTKV